MRIVALVALVGSCTPSEAVPDGLDPETSDTGPPSTDTTDTATSSTTGVDLSSLALPEPYRVQNERFSTSHLCASCHSNADSAQAMRDASGQGIAPVDLWQGSMMANAARDPLWRAMVSAEIAATPSAAAAIEAKCLRCHAPMAATEAELLGEGPLDLSILTSPADRTQLALDGASCTVCHQIEATDLGTEASFSGGFSIEARGVAFGPHADPFGAPMTAMSGFTPTPSEHITRGELCATCHTLRTHAVDAAGTETGGTVLEQAPWLEWRASRYGEFGPSCPACHLPTLDDEGEVLSAVIARAPLGEDFAMLSPRSPFGRHLLVGGNTLVPQLLRDHPELLQPLAPAEAFDATLAAARRQLETRTATVTLEDLGQADGSVSFGVRIGVLTGHKLPTGIPLRRAWIHTIVRDGDGQVWFESGAFDDHGGLVDRDGNTLSAELPGGPVMPHVDRVIDESTVPIYEAVLADDAGAPTWRLMRGEGWAKDNRLLPLGWDPVVAAADGIASVGVDGDPDFGAGGDVVHVTEGTGPWTVEVELRFQTLSTRVATELFATGTPEVRAFQALWGTADRTPERLGSDRATVP